MNRIFVLCLAVFLQTNVVSAQYFYKEIIGNKLAIEELESYKKRNIHQINIKSYEPSDILSDGFYCEKKISKDYQKTTVFSKTNETGRSILTTYFNEKGLPVKTYDSSESYVSTATLHYNDLNQIDHTTTVSRSKDDDFVNEITENHTFLYSANHQLTKLVISKNHSDTTILLFYNDENGNTTIEKNTKNAAKYYYYFDEKNRLTDVVFSNEYKKEWYPNISSTMMKVVKLPK